MKQYMLSVFMEEGFEATEEEMATMYKDVDALNNEIKSQGAWVFAGGLHEPTTATTVRAQGGDVITTDGPFAEAKEQLGGFWVLQCSDLDEALGWARKATVACKGAVEVRPFQDDAG